MGEGTNPKRIAASTSDVAAARADPERRFLLSRADGMAISGSITAWIQQLKEGDRGAMQHLWERYFERLVTLARDKLQGLPCHMVDEEDVALSALKSFCRGDLRVSVALPVLASQTLTDSS
jgi:hypothetical protein